jgi:hypothetical protein
MEKRGFQSKQISYFVLGKMGKHDFREEVL